jgi:hypothetical protein
MSMVDFAKRGGARKRLLAGDVPAWISNSRRSRYIAQVILSAPPWVDRARLESLRAECVWVSEMSGVQHCLDHIVPLNHPRVCGLTVPWNLRIIPLKPNSSKGNYWCPEQMEMFE